MALPMLPGYSFPDPTKKDFKKTQTFNFKNGLVVHSSKSDLQNVGDEALEELPPITLLGPMGTQKMNATKNEAKLDQYIPSDMKYYKKVLRFDAYWKEQVGNEKRDRGACIHYFLEDDTIQVVEPKQPNSGIQQGTILSRQKIPKENTFTLTTPFQTMTNAKTGPVLSPTLSRTTPPVENTFGKSMKGGVRDPNNYLANLSLTDSPPRSPNSSRSSPTVSREGSGRMTPPATTSPSGTRKLANANFYNWEDLSVGIDVVFFGRPYSIVDADSFTRQFYHDQGVELPEAVPLPASLTVERVAPSTRLLSHDLRSPEERYRLRKFLEHDRKVLRFYCVWDDTAVFGERRPFILHYFLVDDTVELREVLPVNSGRDPATTFMKKQRLPKKMTSLSDLKSNADYYTDADLMIGEVVNVFGRKFLLYDADPFTRQYYEDMYGITEFPVVQVEEPVRAAIAREIPEYTGFGSEEDSLQNCLTLVPKVPKKIVKDTQYTSADVMRFTAQLEEGKVGDDERRFVISFFLEDDSFSVFENPMRGIKGGKFMERRKVKNPRTGAFFQPLDFFVGALLEVNAHKFRIIEADAFAMKYIQEHEDEQAEIAATRMLEDVKRATSRLKLGALKKSLSTAQAQTSSPYLSPSTFRQALSKAGLSLDNSSFSTVCNNFSRGQNAIDTDAFLRAME